MIEAMAKHLPPSASTLRLIDVNGETGEMLAERREDLSIHVMSGNAADWSSEVGQVDAVVAFAYMINPLFLEKTFDLMRPGGRLIVVDPKGEVRQDYVDQLEANGYTRILVEPAVECPLPTGVLMRGEKPHTTDSTLERVQTTARQDVDHIDITDFKGRYLHLLIRELPNKPAWSRTPDDIISWKAAAVQHNGQMRYLAFSSLPRAVGFMQPAVLEGKIQDVNKFAKFRKSVALTWDVPLLLNPSPSVLDEDMLWIKIDPSAAEVPDE
jgi:hypothetical protein